jgi:hypothetical protein
MIYSYASWEEFMAADTGLHASAIADSLAHSAGFHAANSILAATAAAYDSAIFGEAVGALPNPSILVGLQTLKASAVGTLIDAAEGTHTAGVQLTGLAAHAPLQGEFLPP